MQTTPTLRFEDRIENPMTELLEGHPFFKGMTRRELKVFADAGIYCEFEPGEIIFREGDAANHFYLVIEGEIALETVEPVRGTFVLQTIGKNQVLGWSWLFPPYQWHFSARSSDATEAIVFPAELLRDKAEQNHDFGYELITRVSRLLLQRLQETRLLLVDFYGFPR